MIKPILAETLKTTTWLYAWAAVPFGLLSGGIRKGEPRQSHWAGTSEPYKGVVPSVEFIPGIDAQGIWKVFDLPDEPSIGQYEPTVDKIYQRFGWYAAVYYQMAFRNVGHGWPALWRKDEPQPWKNKAGLWFGYRPYKDWRDNPDKVYYVPGVWKEKDWES